MNSYEAIQALYDPREGNVNPEVMGEQARQEVDAAARAFQRATGAALDGWLNPNQVAHQILEHRGG